MGFTLRVTSWCVTELIYGYVLLKRLCIAEDQGNFDTNDSVAACQHIHANR